MDKLNAERLRALIDKATDSDLSDGGRYFHEDCSDLTKCGHGDTGEYQNRHDGKLVEWLWNNRAAILAMAEENARLREALDWALNEIRSTTRYDNELQFWNCYDLAQKALGKEKA